MFEAKEKQAQTIKDNDKMIGKLMNANETISYAKHDLQMEMEEMEYQILDLEHRIKERDEEKQELKDANDELKYRILDLEQQMLDRQYYEQHPPPPQPKKRVSRRKVDSLGDFNKAPPTKRNKN